jgi:hypothetical protein
LSALREPIDFVSLHNAYMPFLAQMRGPLDPDAVYLTSMAGYRVVEDDLNQVRQLLDRHKLGTNIRFALTEYAAFFTLNGEMDANIATLGGALYLADLLRALSTRDDILMANYWSLSGNWWFGAISQERQPRPAYHVLRAFSEILRGQILDLRVTSPTFDAPAMGAVPASSGIPTVAAVATQEGGRNQFLIINKSPTAGAVVTVRGGPSRRRGLRLRELADARIYDRSHEQGLEWRDVPVDADAAALRLSVRPHSLLWVEFDTR